MSPAQVLSLIKQARKIMNLAQETVSSVYILFYGKLFGEGRVGT